MEGRTNIRRFRCRSVVERQVWISPVFGLTGRRRRRLTLPAVVLGLLGLALLGSGTAPGAFAVPRATEPSDSAQTPRQPTPAASSEARPASSQTGAQIAVANDTCASAEGIPSAGPFPYLTSVADFSTATSAGDPVPSCQTQASGGVWFTFTPSVSANYTFSTCQSVAPGTTRTNTILAVFNATSGACPQGAQIACNDDDAFCSPETGQSTVLASLTAGNTYFIVAYSASATAVNTVQLYVNRGPANDGCESAVALTLDTPVSGTTQFAGNDYRLSGGTCFTGVGQTPSTASGRDVVYTFTAPSTGAYSFRVGKYGTGNPVLFLASTCPGGTKPINIGTCLAASNRSSGPSEEVFCRTIGAGSTVYAYVDEPSVGAGSAFTLEVNRCSRESEPNGTPAEADGLPCGVEGSIAPAGDADFYRLGTPPAGTRLFAFADTLAGNGAGGNTTGTDLRFRVTTDTDTLEFDEDDADAAYGTAAPSVAGTPLTGAPIYLRVDHPNAATQAEPYRLYWTLQPGLAGATAETEPNNTTAQANQAPSEYFLGTLAGPSPSSDTDLYRFQAAPGDLVYLSLDADPLRDATPINAKLDLLDGAGFLLASSNDNDFVSNATASPGTLLGTSPSSPSEALAYRTAAGGTFYARVSIGTASPNPFGSGDYLLAISKGCGTAGQAPAADLSVSLADAPDPVLTRQNVTYTATVVDNGPGEAESAVFGMSTPPNTTFVSLTPPAGWSCGAPPPGGTGAIGCTTTRLDPSAPAVFTIVVKVAQCAGSGDITASASVSSAASDLDPSNNTAQQSTTIQDPGTCDDGNPCTTADLCSGATCVGGPPPTCDDGIACTVDSCNPPTGCAHTGNNSACSDGNPCTNDFCNPASGCTYTNNSAPCSDGNACSMNDVCVSGTCIGGPPVNCNDADSCTDDFCSPGTGCYHLFNSGPCEDENECTSGDTCHNGTCMPGGPTNCDDGNPCTDDSCDPQSGCGHANNSASCDDANPCTVSESCSGGLCQNGTPVPGPCNDGNACTTGDACSAGSCVGGPPPSCSDGNPCTDDVCVPSSGCQHPFNTAPCSDSSVCTTGDVCSEGSCVGTPISCDDGVNCTADSCHPTLGCQHPNGCAGGGVCNTSSGLCEVNVQALTFQNDGSYAGTHDTYIQQGNPTTTSGGALTWLWDNQLQGNSSQAVGLLRFANIVGGGAGQIPQGARVLSATLGLTVVVAGTAPAGEIHTSLTTWDQGTATWNNFGGDAGVQPDETGPLVGSAPLALGAFSLSVTANVQAWVNAPATNFGWLFLPLSNKDVGVRSSEATPTTERPKLTVQYTTTQSCATPADCADGNACNGVETCVNNVCNPGVPPNCNDGNVCTDDSCQPAAGCVHTNNTASCNDGNACTTNDVCSGSACVGGAPPNCDDANICTDDGCAPASGCTHAPNSAPCSDGNACTTSDTCAGGGCAGGPPPDCADTNPCTDDVCNVLGGCLHFINTASCDDGNACTVGESCNIGACQGGSPADCNDGNPCTNDSCNPASGCVHGNNTATCSDGNACTTGDACSGGACVPGPATNCDDGNVCTNDSCSPATGCAHANNTAACDDGNPCTAQDTCGGGACAGGGPTDCNDGNGCTDDSCSPPSGCAHAPRTGACDDANPCTSGESCSAGQCQGGSPVAGPCEDGSLCTTGDLCQGGVCVGGAAPNCDDGNPCRDDACDPALGCVHANNTASCSDGNACTTNDACVAGACAGGPPPNCNDGNPCTDDTCSPASGCQHANNTAPCSDGNPCTGGDTCGGGACHPGPPASGPCDDGNVCTTNDACSAGACAGGPPPSCSDGNPCTDDSCVPGTGCVHANNTAACSDGSACTTNDVCVNGACVGGAPPSCNDQNPCTDDSCSSAVGCVHANNTGPCTDGNACTTNDTCANGSCAPGAPLSCDDGNPCTADSCVSATGCAHANVSGPCNDGNPCTNGDTCSAGACQPGAPVSGPCSDGNACTSGDTCSAGGCVPGPAVSCNDGNPCTDDACNPHSGCFHTNNAAPCSDGSVCTTGDVCANGACTGSPISCADTVNCTADSCHPVNGCQHTNGCPGSATCNPGTGLCEGQPATVSFQTGFGGYSSAQDTDIQEALPDVAEGLSVFYQWDVQNQGSHSQIVGLQRFDNIFGSGPGQIPPGSPIQSATLNLTVIQSGGAGEMRQCLVPWDQLTATWNNFGGEPGVQADEMGPVLGPAPFAIGTASIDVTSSVQGWSNAPATNFGWIFVPLSNNQVWVRGSETSNTTERPKLTVTLSSAQGCTGNPQCSDGSVCTGTETCVNNVCNPGVPLDCNDGNPCTIDSCNPVTGCAHSAGGTSCSDGNACTDGDACSGLSCAPGPALACDDGNPCTLDACSASTGCTHTNDPSACNDANPCTDDACNPVTGCSHANNSASCDDGSACTLSDACAGGSCAGVPLSCDDGLPCTTDSCNPASGCVHTTPDADSDGVCDPLDNCPQTPNAGQQNQDGDPRGDACDCMPLNNTIWAVPSDVPGLRLAGNLPTGLTWNPPSEPGGSQQVLYDLLRSGSRTNFTGTEPSAVCLATGVAGPPASDPGQRPAAGASYFYLVRVSNACGGNLGTSSSGVPRAGRVCP